MITHYMIKWLFFQLLATAAASSSMYATTLKEPKAITVTEDSVTDTSLFLTWDAVPKGIRFTFFSTNQRTGFSNAEILTNQRTEFRNF
jgi:hypothetical protein